MHCGKKSIFGHKIERYGQIREGDGDILTWSLRLNENLEEQIPRPVEAFPVSACYESFAVHDGGCVPWHWHSDVEFTWILQGSIRLSTNHGTYTLQTGDGAFINANALHYKETLPGNTPLALTLVFDPLLISGFHKSIYEQKYVEPVLRCRELEAMHLSPANTDERKILEWMRAAYEAADKEQQGYEFVVRGSLSSAWFLLYQILQPRLQSRAVVEDQGEKRIKRMMVYIRQHYQEKVTLEEIAAAASISSRECLRCFQQKLNTTPFTYLSEYRVRQAAQELRDTDRSVMDIAYENGFSGASYFGKTFKRFMNCSPSEYRALHKED